jgi:hypothetical protein
VQEAAARAQKVKRSTWGAMAAQEQLLTPMDPYEPVSTFDASDRKKHASSALLTPVTNFGELKQEPANVAQVAQALFLRQVEQVRVYKTRQTT